MSELAERGFAVAWHATEGSFGDGLGQLQQRYGFARIETMVLMAGMDLPMRAIREQISHAINIVVQQSRMRDGSRKITKISEITGMEGDIIVMQDLFVFEYSDNVKGKLGELEATGIIPNFLDRLSQRDVYLSQDLFRR